MDADTTQIAGAAVTILAPFTPYLIDVGKTAGKKLAETIAAKGGEAAWKKAQDLWGKLTKHWGDDPEIKGATMMVAAKPEEESYQTMLAKALATRLQEKPELAACRRGTNSSPLPTKPGAFSPLA
jgi:hypothetical protein